MGGFELEQAGVEFLFCFLGRAHFAVRGAEREFVRVGGGVGFALLVLFHERVQVLHGAAAPGYFHRYNYVFVNRKSISMDIPPEIAVSSNSIENVSSKDAHRYTLQTPTPNRFSINPRAVQVINMDIQKI